MKTKKPQVIHSHASPATEQLQRSEEFAKSLFESNPNCVKILDLDGNLLTMNTPGLAIMEIEDFSKFKGRCWIDFWENEDNKEAKKAVTLAKKGKTGHFVGYTPTTKGNYRWWDVTVSPIYDEKGKVYKLLSVSQDISKYKNIEVEKELLISQLKIEKSRLTKVFENAPAFICTLKGNDYIFELANHHYLQLVGNRKIIGKTLKEALPEVVEQGFIKILDTVFQTGKAFVGNEILVYLQRKKHGLLEARYVNFVYQPIKESDNSISGIFVHGVDVTEQVLSRKKIEESEERLHFMADSMPQQVWTATPEGALDYVNLYTVNYFNKNVKQIIGAGWQKFIHPEDLPECIKLWTASLKTGKPYQVYFRLKKSDSSYRWHLGRALAMKDNERVVKWYGTNTDVDDQIKLEKQKDEFISIATHELKTPVTSLKAYAEVLQRKFTKSGDEFSAISMGKMNTQLNKLTNLIGDLLDSTKVDTGKLYMQKETFAFDALVEEIREEMQRVTDQHRLIIKGSTKKNIVGDRERLGQVLTNLISNAIKYSPLTKEIMITVSIETKNIKVSVQDFGVGIPKSKQKHVFERFYRVSGTKVNTFPGLGLGLYISSEIIKREGGRIWVDSTPGKGSTFSFTLPFKDN